MFNFKNQKLKITHLSGFTLIELMIVVLIMGILAAITYPSYTQYVLRGKRTEGRAMLMDSAAKLERYYSDNNRYTATLSDANISSTSENGYYQISISSTTPFQAYTLTAQPVTFSDPDCGNLTLDQAGTKNKTGSAELKECWNR